MKRRSKWQRKQDRWVRRLKKSVIAIVSMLIVELLVPGQFWFEGGARYVDFLNRFQLDPTTHGLLLGAGWVLVISLFFILAEVVDAFLNRLGRALMGV